MRIGHIQNISVTHTLQVSNRLCFKGFLNHRLCLPHCTWYFLINFIWINQLLQIHFHFWHPNHPMIMTSNAEDIYYGLFCFFYIYFLRISPQIPQFLFLLKTEQLRIILFSNAMSLSLPHFPKLKSLLCSASSYMKGHPSLLVLLYCYILFLVLLYSLKNRATRIAQNSKYACIIP